MPKHIQFHSIQFTRSKKCKLWKLIIPNRWCYFVGSFALSFLFICFSLLYPLFEFDSKSLEGLWNWHGVKNSLWVKSVWIRIAHTFTKLDFFDGKCFSKNSLRDSEADLALFRSICKIYFTSDLSPRGLIVGF